MTKIEKKLEKMRNNPKNWNVADLEIIASQFGITVRRGKGSHVTFSHSKSTDILTVPDHRPVKAVYIKKFIVLIELLEGVKYETTYNRIPIYN